MRVRLGAFELSKLGVARFDLRDPYHILVAASWPRFLGVLLALVLVINAGFALLYLAVPGSVVNARPGVFGDAFFFSIETLATVGYGVMAPANTYGHVVSAAEIIFGMGFTALVTGMTFVRFSRPKAKIVYADSAVVTLFNGRPALMIRIANGRTSLMTDARARLGVLIKEQTEEGQLFRRFHELRLAQPRLALFALTWTLIHIIDETSPIAGYDGALTIEGDLRLFLTVEARDHALSSSVYDIRDYGAAQILFGARYLDAVTFDEQGRTVADLTRISLVEPDGRGPWALHGIAADGEAVVHREDERAYPTTG